MISTYKGYVVHSDGRIEKKKGRGFINFSMNDGGYFHHNFSLEGIQKTETIHRVVWKAFNGPIPDGMTIDHIDNNKLNNRLDNLQLLTSGENNSKDKQKLSKKQIELITYLKANTNYTTYQIAEEVGTSQSSVMRVLKNPIFAYVY